MPVPKFRTSASKRDMRRSHHALKDQGISKCPSCEDIRMPHTACPKCGYYKNRLVIGLGDLDFQVGKDAGQDGASSK